MEEMKGISIDELVIGNNLFAIGRTQAVDWGIIYDLQRKNGKIIAKTIHETEGERPTHFRIGVLKFDVTEDLAYYQGGVDSPHKYNDSVLEELK